MSFNLGLANHPTSRMGGLSSVGVYLYEDIYYRQWITEIALAFYEGRQDEFIWLDLVRQFRNPEKQQILPVNLTKEIVDEVAILYQEMPVYQVVDESGKILSADQKLWEDIMEQSRYCATMDKVDRWTKLLGTVLVKASFVNPDTGQMVDKTEGGQLQLDVVHGGVYDVKHGASPYYITELLIGFGNKFGGFGGGAGPGGVASNVASPSNFGMNDALAIKSGEKVNKFSHLQSVNKIYWTPNEHVVTDEDNKYYEVKNPYGSIPAVPFFNQDPAHYYFLPINEPLVYANHALNMRITDLNHIAKFQSFGVPVVKGVERSNSLRHGRPVDDFNQLKGGTAQSRFGGISGVSGFGAGGQFRTFDSGFGIHRDGNADANALGLSLGPDTAVAVGEKGDFKFAHPSADITGLTKTIHSIADMVRVNHGLRPKHESDLEASGYSLYMSKLGVIQENVRRGRLFAQREKQLFQVIKGLWNTHNSKTGSKRFSENAVLEVSYKIPEFPTDPKTKKEDLILEQQLISTGDRHSIKKLYPHKKDPEISKMIKDRRKDMMEQAKFEAETEVEKAKILKKAGILEMEKNTSSQITKGGSTASKSTSITLGDGGSAELKVSAPKMDNKLKDSQAKSNQGPQNTNKDAKTGKTKK